MNYLLSGVRYMKTPFSCGCKRLSIQPNPEKYLTTATDKQMKRGNPLEESQ
jgi:hypothetical protein